MFGETITSFLIIGKNSRLHDKPMIYSRLELKFFSRTFENSFSQNFPGAGSMPS